MINETGIMLLCVLGAITINGIIDGMCFKRIEKRLDRIEQILLRINRKT